MTDISAMGPKEPLEALFSSVK